MWHNNIKMALMSLRTTKWRSFLTMLGIIVGVVSVVTTVSLGEGVKQQVVGQITQLGSDLITVRPGRVVNRDVDGNVTSYNLVNLLGSGALSATDLEKIQTIGGIAQTVPMSLISGALVSGDTTYDDGFVVATTASAPQVLNQKMAFGEFFTADDNTKKVAVIGQDIAERLFQENVPIGKSFTLRGETFVVRGVFEEFPVSPLTPTADYNNAVFIPYGTGTALAADQARLYQVLIKPQNPDDSALVAANVNQALLDAHAGQRDFTVLQQAENLALANSVLNLLTGLIAGVAAISLLVGGIGIMNIMLVSVTERTHEIGVRKAIGATNQQILGQFLIESAVIGITGGIIGVILAIATNYLLRIFTDLQPVITLPIVLIATGVSLLVGIIFGVAPALRAARKDPIQALRQYN